MFLSNLSKELLTLFTDDRITRDLNEQLFQGSTDGEKISIELEGAVSFEIPANCRHAVCSVVLQSDLIPTALEVRVFCAVGGVKSESCGIIESNICFAVLTYNQAGALITYELHATQFH
jgi:hypothetical protein